MPAADPETPKETAGRHDNLLSAIVRAFLDSSLSVILIVFSLVIGAAALLATPREEDPQIVVPLADVHVSFPGHSAAETEQLVATPLERVLYQIDGVEYVYSMSRDNGAVITVRFHVGQDRERSLVKLFKKLDENRDVVPPGVAGWIVKPVEIDDVPVVTLAVRGMEADSHELRRLGEELVERLAAVPQVSRVSLIGGEPRTVRIELDPDRLRGYNLTALEVQRAIQSANVTLPAGDFTKADRVVVVEAGVGLERAAEFDDLVVGVTSGNPVFLKDVATVRDGAAEPVSDVRHGWGPARDFAPHPDAPGTELTDGGILAGNPAAGASGRNPEGVPAVTLAVSKQKGSNAVTVSRGVLEAARTMVRDVLPSGVQLVVTRNSGQIADEKVNELVEALAVAIVIVIALLTLGLGWREALIVAVAVPVVFGLTLGINLVAGYTINRVTLFALILSLGLLVDDPIVDVENIVRHFRDRGRATREIVMDAVAEIRPPLISATLAVIVSFLPMFFITGMMGPYMSPMALNVPIAMLMSMLVAFTITPWLTFHVLKGHFPGVDGSATTAVPGPVGLYDPEVVRQSPLYRFFKPLMAPLLATRLRAVLFLVVMALLMIAATGLAATRSVPLKMLPFDNKNELLLLLDLDEGTTRERTRAVVEEFERRLAGIPEVTDFTSYTGVAGPIDFNGLVRHYYLRQGPHQAEIRVNLVGKKHRALQSHALALQYRNELTELASRLSARLQLVELPPGPPVLAALVAEVSGRPDQTYDELLAGAGIVAERLRREPGVAEVDDVLEAPVEKLVFQTDKEKAALAGLSTAQIAETIRLGLEGQHDQTLRQEGERQPLRVTLRLPREVRSDVHGLNQLEVRGQSGALIPLSELGRWESRRVGQTIYHKNLQRVVYVFAECVGRPPADCIMDVLADRVNPEVPTGRETRSEGGEVARGFMADRAPRPLSERTFFSNGGGIPWSVPDGVRIELAGEGEWKITLDVFRDLGLAFGAALLMIYIILVAQTGSFLIPLVVMLAIPLTVLGVMPGFYLLNAVSGQTVGGYPDSVYFTATAMIGMIALSGIVTRDSLILVDFIELSVKQGRSLMDAILESRVVRLRPILLTAGAALLSSLPITFDPIFSGLGWSLIFGLVASTLFTLFAIPVTYWLLKSRTVRS